MLMLLSAVYLPVRNSILSIHETGITLKHRCEKLRPFMRMNSQYKSHTTLTMRLDYDTSYCRSKSYGSVMTSMMQPSPAHRVHKPVVPKMGEH